MLCILNKSTASSRPIIVANICVKKGEFQVGAEVGHGARRFQERPLRKMIFGKAPKPVAKGIIEIPSQLDKTADLQIVLEKIAIAAGEIQGRIAFVFEIESAGQGNLALI